MTTLRAPRFQLPPWTLPAAGLLLIAGAMLAVIWLSRQVGTDDAPSEPPPFALPAADRGLSLYTVRQSSGGTLALAGEQREGEPRPADRDLALAPATPVELLRPATTTDLRPGDIVTVVAIPNEVRNFAIHSLVILPAGSTVDSNGIARSAAGFAGHEAAHDPRDRPVLSAAITSVSTAAVVLTGPGGPITVTLSASPPLFRLAPGAAADIHDGDRIVLRGAEGAAPQAVLVLQVR